MKPLYSAGDIALVRYGESQNQLARVLATKGMLVQVEKWRVNSGTWGKPAWVPERKMLGPAPADDPRREAALGAAGTTTMVLPSTEPAYAKPFEPAGASGPGPEAIPALRAIAKPGPGRSLLEKLLGGRRS